MIRGLGLIMLQNYLSLPLGHKNERRQSMDKYKKKALPLPGESLIEKMLCFIII
jgi:hypothetical protein